MITSFGRVKSGIRIFEGLHEGYIALYRGLFRDCISKSAERAITPIVPLAVTPPLDASARGG